MKRLTLLLITLLLAGCTTLYIDRSYTAKSQESRVQFLIIHYTAGGFKGSLKTLTEGPVSSHFLVQDNPPTIYRLVEDNRRAFHAGVSYWKGNTALNASSIGIEIVNLGNKQTPEGRVWFDFPPDQIDAVVSLVKMIVAEHKIPPDRVLAHSDIAPNRKPDPGPKFPWKRLADEGLIIWPDSGKVALKRAEFERELPDILWFQQKLAKHGFATQATGEFDNYTRDCLTAFQMKYRPAKFDGEMDAETAAMLEVLTSP